MIPRVRSSEMKSVKALEVLGLKIDFYLPADAKNSSSSECFLADFPILGNKTVESTLAVPAAGMLISCWMDLLPPVNSALLPREPKVRWATSTLS